MYKQSKISLEISFVFQKHLCSFPESLLYFCTKGMLNRKYCTMIFCAAFVVKHLCPVDVQTQKFFQYYLSRNIFYLKLWVDIHVLIRAPPPLDAFCQPNVYIFIAICTFCQCPFTVWLFIVMTKISLFIVHQGSTFTSGLLIRDLNLDLNICKASLCQCLCK